MVVFVVVELLLVFVPKAPNTPVVELEGVEAVPVVPKILLPAIPVAVVDVFAPNTLPAAVAGVVDEAGLAPPNTNSFCQGLLEAVSISIDSRLNGFGLELWVPAGFAAFPGPELDAVFSGAGRLKKPIIDNVVRASPTLPLSHFLKKILLQILYI